MMNREVSDRRGLVGEYHAACRPCGTISPRIARFNCRSRRRADHVRKAKRGSQFKVVDLVRTRDSEEEIAGRGMAK